MPPAGLVTLEDAETGKLRLVDTRSASVPQRARDRARATGRTRCAISCARPAWTWSCSTHPARWSIPCCGSSANARGGCGDEGVRRCARSAVARAGRRACWRLRRLRRPPTAPSAAPITPAKDALAKTTEDGPVKAAVKVWPAKPTLGDAIYVRLEIDAPAGVDDRRAVPGGRRSAARPVPRRRVHAATPSASPTAASTTSRPTRSTRRRAAASGSRRCGSR